MGSERCPFILATLLTAQSFASMVEADGKQRFVSCIRNDSLTDGTCHAGVIVSRGEDGNVVYMARGICFENSK
jgi:hypothetical protein